MFKQAVLVAAATASALAAAHGMLQLNAAHGEAQVAISASPTNASATSDSGAAPAPAQVSKASDGHFWAEAEVDGRWVRLLVDTGATSVALTAQDAQRLGLDLSTLTFDRPVSTANGETRAAAVVLDHVAIAGARIDHVDALVVRQGLSSSLLGMTYLGRLSRFEATPTALVLRP